MFQSLGRMELSLREERIVWPGGRRRKPSGLMIPTHLKVITQPEKPFVYFRPLGQELVVAQGDDNFVTSNLDEGEACFEHGFHTCIIDLVGYISAKLKFAEKLKIAAKEKEKRKTTIGTGIIVGGEGDDEDDSGRKGESDRGRKTNRDKRYLLMGLPKRIHSEVPRDCSATSANFRLLIAAPRARLRRRRRHRRHRRLWARRPLG